MDDTSGFLPQEIEWQKNVDTHKLTRILRGHLAHVTTTENLPQIIEDGLIRASASQDGMLPTAPNANPSACQRLGAVSLFDFDVEDDKLYPPGMIEGEYLKHWWHYLGRRRAAVVILIGDQVRRSVVSEGFGPGQHIYGVEVCHEGNVPLSAFTGYIFRKGRLMPEAGCSVDQYDADEASRLVEDVQRWNDTA